MFWYNLMVLSAPLENTQGWVGCQVKPANIRQGTRKVKVVRNEKNVTAEKREARRGEIREREISGYKREEKRSGYTREEKSLTNNTHPSHDFMSSQDLHWDDHWVGDEVRVHLYMTLSETQRDSIQTHSVSLGLHAFQTHVSSIN